MVEFKLAGNEVSSSAQLGISFAFKFRKSVGVNLAILHNCLGQVTLVREAISRDESGELSDTLGRARGRNAGGHAAGLDTFHRALGNGITIVADFIFVAAAIFPDVIGEDGAAVLQVDRVSRRRRAGQHHPSSLRK